MNKKGSKKGQKIFKKWSPIWSKKGGTENRKKGTDLRFFKIFAITRLIKWSLSTVPVHGTKKITQIFLIFQNIFSLKSFWKSRNCRNLTLFSQFKCRPIESDTQLVNMGLRLGWKQLWFSLRPGCFREGGRRMRMVN